jgi:hypothetical protein
MITSMDASKRNRKHQTFGVPSLQSFTTNVHNLGLLLCRKATQADGRSASEIIRLACIKKPENNREAFQVSRVHRKSMCRRTNLFVQPKKKSLQQSSQDSSLLLPFLIETSFFFGYCNESVLVNKQSKRLSQLFRPE